MAGELERSETLLRRYEKLKPSDAEGVTKCQYEYCLDNVFANKQRAGPDKRRECLPLPWDLVSVAIFP
jgi:hypothetical protein